MIHTRAAAIQPRSIGFASVIASILLLLIIVVKFMCL